MYGLGGLALVALVVVGIILARRLGPDAPDAPPSPTATPAPKARGLSNDKFGPRARTQASANVDIGVKTVRTVAPSAPPSAAGRGDTIQLAQLASPQAQATPNPLQPGRTAATATPQPTAATPAPAPDLPKFPPLAAAPQPQGREAVVVYAKGPSGKRQVFLRSLERESDDQLVTSVYDDYGVSLSSSTQKVAFYSNEEGASDQDRPRAKLKVVDLATNKTTVITGGLPGSWPVAWSPDGKKLAIPTTRSIFISDVTTGASLQVPTGTAPGGIVWSPSGLRFYYQAQGTGNATDIFEADATSAAARPLTATPAEEKLPSVSSDGAVVSFLRAQTNGGFAVVTRGLADSAERTVAASAPTDSYLWNLDYSELLVTKGAPQAKLTELKGEQSRTVGSLPNPQLVGWDRDYQHVFVLADDDNGRSLFSVDRVSGDAEKVKADIAASAPLSTR